MKVYSDVFTYSDMKDAARFARVRIDTAEKINRPRTRTRGWKIRLSGSSTRHRNSGNQGAATWDTSPATHDEHGQWMAFLFDIDPGAKIAEYDGQADFVYATHGVYGADWQTGGKLREDGGPDIQVATCGHCGRSWNDALITSRTPTPSGRCPFEDKHIYDETGV